MQAQFCSSNRLDFRREWIEEVLFEKQSKMKASWNEDTIGIKKIEFCMVLLKNYSQKSGVRLIGKQPEWPSSLAFIPDFCRLKKTCALMSIFSFDFEHEKMLDWVLWHVILRYNQILSVSLPNPVAAVIQPQNSKTEHWILWWPSCGHIFRVITIFSRVYVYFCSR